MDHAALHDRARQKGANLVVYWLARAVLQPFFLAYFRMSRIGREHFPAKGPVIVAANHRSFLDPFVIGTMARRPMYYVAKVELFRHRLLAWLLNALGAFPIDRGSGDRDMVRTARKLLERGEIVLIFVEGTRVRPGALGKPRKGVGRLALETGAPVVPVAVIGTEAVRRGWRIRPHKVRVRAGRPLRFPHAPDASPQLAAAVTARIWPCVMLQWEWLGGLPSIRRAVVIGAGRSGTRLAVCLARAGFDVDLGCRTEEQADALARSRVNERYLPDLKLPARVAVMAAARIELAGHDLVCLALPARALPDVLATHGEQITQRSALMVLSDGLVPPDGTLPSAYVAQRTAARAVAVLGGASRAANLLDPGARVLVASLDAGYARQLAEALRAARLDVSISEDVTGVEFGGCAVRVAVLAAAAAAPAGDAAAAAAATVVSAEVQALARSRGGKHETFAAVFEVSDDVLIVPATGSLDPHSGEQPVNASGSGPTGSLPALAAELAETVSLLVHATDEAGIDAPAIDELLELIEGRIELEQWLETITESPPSRRSRRIRAA
ncbi:MAG: 1-acyl-sn-glycerol-3-phosphate acyltransferase [Solirubrobacteraceae bacterium]